MINVYAKFEKDLRLLKIYLDKKRLEGTEIIEVFWLGKIVENIGKTAFIYPIDKKELNKKGLKFLGSLDNVKEFVQNLRKVIK